MSTTNHKRVPEEKILEKHLGRQNAQKSAPLPGRNKIAPNRPRAEPPGEAADRLTVVAVVVVGRIDVARVEVEVVGVASIRVRSRRPIITLVACVPQRPRVDVPAAH